MKVWHLAMRVNSIALDNVVSHMGDKFNLNIKLATCMRVDFIGCDSHRFNHDVWDILKENEEVMFTLRSIMVKLRTVIDATKLLEFTHLRAVLDNKTRWSYYFKMLTKYLRIKRYLRGLVVKEISQLLPSQRVETQIKDVVDHLLELDSVRIFHQHESLKLGDADVIFDEVIAEFPDTNSRNLTEKLLSIPCW